MEQVGERKSSLNYNTNNDKSEERDNYEPEDHDVNNDDSEHDDGGEEESVESDEREEVSEEGEGEEDQPEEIQTHMDTLSSLYEQSLNVARRNPDGSYTESFCQLIEKIREVCSDFECFWRQLDDDEQSTAVERLLKSRVIDLLCDVIVEGLGSDSRTSTTAHSLLCVVINILDKNMCNYPIKKMITEVCRRVRDDDRLLPVLLETLRDWYQPHMDNTATAPQNEILRRSLKIIYNTALLNDTDTADRLCQLDTTDVLVNYLKSADRHNVKLAAFALRVIVTEPEAAKLASGNGFYTTFCEMVRRQDCLAAVLTDNTAICRVLTQEGSALSALVEEGVRQTDDTRKKRWYLHALRNLCKNQHQSMRTADKEQIVELAVTQYRSHTGTDRESGWCRGLARAILKALLDDLERTPQYSQLCIELGFQPVDGGTGGRKRKLDDDQQTTSDLNATESDLSTESSTVLPPSPKRQTTLYRDQPELAVNTASPMELTAPSPVVVNLPAPPEPYDDELRAAGSHALSLTPGTSPAPTASCLASPAPQTPAPPSPRSQIAGILHTPASRTPRTRASPTPRTRASPVQQIPDSPSCSSGQQFAELVPSDDDPNVESTSVDFSANEQRNMQDQYRELKNRNKELEERLRQYEEEVNRLQDRNRDLEEKVMQCEEEYTELEEKHEYDKNRIRHLEGEEIKAQVRHQKLKEQRTQLERKNKGLEDKLTKYKHRASEVEKEYIKYQRQARELEKEHRRYKDKNRELEEEHRRYKDKNRELEEARRKYQEKMQAPEQEHMHHTRKNTQKGDNTQDFGRSRGEYSNSIISDETPGPSSAQGETEIRAPDTRAPEVSASEIRAPEVREPERGPESANTSGDISIADDQHTQDD